MGFDELRGATRITCLAPIRTGHEGILLPLFTHARKTMTSRIILHVATQSAVNKWQCSGPRDSDVLLHHDDSSCRNHKHIPRHCVTLLVYLLHYTSSTNYQLPALTVSTIHQSTNLTYSSSYEIMTWEEEGRKKKKEKKTVAAPVITWPQALFYKTQSINNVHTQGRNPPQSIAILIQSSRPNLLKAHF